MKRIVCFALLGWMLLSFKCSSENPDYAVFNGTHKNIVVLSQDEFSKNNGRISFDSEKGPKNLVEPYDMNYFLFPDSDHHLTNKKALIFYFIDEKDFERSYEEIKTRKLYDSLYVPSDQYHWGDSDNYIFKNDSNDWAFTHNEDDFTQPRAAEVLK